MIHRLLHHVATEPFGMLCVKAAAIGLAVRLVWCS